MELKQLEYFIAAAKHLNFTRAAQECCIVQSAMSQQMAALERELGVSLFERTNRGLRLTPEGEAMAREARRLLDQAEIAQDIVRRAKHSYVNVLRIGCHGNLLREELPAALSRFRIDHPHTRVLLKSGMFQSLLGELREGQIDCMFALFQPGFSSLDWADSRIICDEPVYAVLPASHPLCALQTLCMRDLSGIPQILFTGDDKKQLVRDIQDSGIDTSVYAYTSSQNCIEALVAAGYGVSMCVRSAARPHPGIVYRPMSDRPVSTTVCLWHKNSETAERVRDLVSLLLMTQTE